MTDVVGRGWSFPIRLNNQGQITLAQGDNEINQAIHLILSTSLGERVMRPEFGCRLHELVFEPNDISTAATAEAHVTEALGRWEPRIRVTEVRAYPSPEDTGILMIQIDYEIKATQDPRSLVFPFYLLPDDIE